MICVYCNQFEVRPFRFRKAACRIQAAYSTNTKLNVQAYCVLLLYLDETEIVSYFLPIALAGVDLDELITGKDTRVQDAYKTFRIKCGLGKIAFVRETA